MNGCGIACLFILILFNISLTLVGSSFLGLGLWLRFNGNTRVVFEIEDLQSWVFVMDVKIIIVLGTFMLFTALFGFSAGSSKKRSSLQMYTVFLSLLLFVVLGLLGLTIGNSAAVGRNIMEFYISMYALYDGADPIVGTALRFIHYSLHCCGVTGVRMIETTCPKPSGFLEHLVMPNCPLVIADFFNRRAPVIGFFTASAFILIIPMICSSILCKKVRAPVSPPQYTVMTNYALATPQPLQQGFVPASCSYPNPNPDPDLFPLIPVPEAPVVKA
ncbi:CD9 antigen-like [Platichthys flesus]|uniref:CD9 antigen-like n=1 Tax=Platichthys flesus TaxID=8260 RepID=UPI002DB6AAD7|nr:CD9 antigen-like [Platichthys flesus]